MIKEQPCLSLDQISFEYPLNERSRMFLRLEFLFEQIDYFSQQRTPNESRHCLQAFIETNNYIERTDLKTEALQEIDRLISHLKQLSKNQHVNKSHLSQILEELQYSSNQLQLAPSKLLNPLKENAFLSGVRQRLNIPGGTCLFDCPDLHQWLHMPSSLRLKQMHSWLAPLNPLKHAVLLLLRLVRDSSESKLVLAKNGYHQIGLCQSLPCQLIIVRLINKGICYPEISGNKHRANIRFLNTQFEQHRSKAVDFDVEFELTCCSI